MKADSAGEGVTVFPTQSADTVAQSFDEVIRRLQSHQMVDGILLMGSTATDRRTPTSDYDVTLVLTHLPTPVKLVTTWIGESFAEIYCTTTTAIKRVIAEPDRWEAGTEEEALIRWARMGQIVHDRHGLLHAAQEAAFQAPVKVLGESAIYWGWWGIGYNVAHMRRYAAGDDPVSQDAARIRLLWSIFQVVAHYFTMRSLPWRGEKEAVRYLMAHDPAFYDLLNQCLLELDVQRKAYLYEELAKMTVAPVGGLWTFGETAVELGPGFGTGDEPSHGPPDKDAEAGLRFWKSLVGYDPTSRE